MSDSTTPTTIEKLKNIQNKLESEEYQECHNECTSILKEDESVEIRPIIEKINIRCLLKTNEYQEALNLCRLYKKTEGSSFIEEEAYAYYRLKRYDACRDVCLKSLQEDNVIKVNGKGRFENIQSNNSKERSLLHILGQCCYRLYDKENGIKIYEFLLEGSNEALEEERSEMVTNFLALVISNYHGLSPPREELMRRVDELLAEELSTAENNYDLEYNAGTFLSISNRSAVQTEKALDMLRDSISHCRDDEDEKEEENWSELSPIKANLAYTLLRSGDSASGKDILDQLQQHESNLPPHVQAVIRHNLSIAQKDTVLPPIDDAATNYLLRPQLQTMNLNRIRHSIHNPPTTTTNKKKDAKQQDTIHQNISQVRKYFKKNKAQDPQLNAALQLQLDVLDYCSKASAEKKQPPLPKTTPNQHPYTKAYITCLDAQHHLQQYRSKPEDTQPELSKAISILQNIDPALLQKPGYLSTMASLHTINHDEKQALELLQTHASASIANEFQADILIQKQQYKQACDIYQTLYEEEEDTRRKHTILAKLIIAKSYVDVDDAEELMALLPPSAVQDEEPWSADQVEMFEVPTTHTRRVRKLAGDDNRTQIRHKKSKEAILRQRARKRETYLSKLASQGKYDPDKPIKPDPERWIKKSLRTRGRRYRKSAGTTAQGAMISEKEMARLDVAAGRRESGGSKPSTAHMEVSRSGGGKRRGRRR